MAKGASVRTDPLAADALAVAYETMTRVDANIRTLVARLTDMGFEFTTPDGQRRAFIAGAARGDAETKRSYFARYFGDGTLNEEWAAGSLGAFNALEHEALTLPYLRPALDSRGLISLNGVDVLPAGRISVGLTMDYGRGLLRVADVGQKSTALVRDSFTGTASPAQRVGIPLGQINRRSGR